MTYSPVHLWMLETSGLSEAIIERWTEVLDSTERGRAHGFRFFRDHRDYVAAHAMLRALLAEIGGLPAPHWRWQAEEPLGKPRLTVPEDSGLCFNLSHADGLVAAVVAADREVGVDVEKRGRLSDIDGLADHVLTTAEITALPPAKTDNAARCDAFLRHWVIKEATAKAVGLGLSLPLTAITATSETAPRVRIEDGHAPAEAGWATKGWAFRELRPNSGHLAAVVAETAVGHRQELANLHWQMLREAELDEKLQA